MEGFITSSHPPPLALIVGNFDPSPLFGGSVFTPPLYIFLVLYLKYLKWEIAGIALSFSGAGFGGGFLTSPHPFPWALSVGNFDHSALLGGSAFTLPLYIFLVLYLKYLKGK